MIDARNKAEEPEVFPTKKFANALMGLPSDYKHWQEYYEEGNLDKVFDMWCELAEREKSNSKAILWTAIIALIKHKQDVALREAEKNLIEDDNFIRCCGDAWTYGRIKQEISKRLREKVSA